MFLGGGAPKKTENPLFLVEPNINISSQNEKK